MSQVEGFGKTIKCATGDVKFVVHRFPPKRARRHVLIIGKVIAPTVGALVEKAVSAKGKGKGFEDADIPFGDLIAKLVERLDVDYTERLMDDCAELTTCEPGGPLDRVYDAVFAGCPSAQAKWFAHAMGVQFGDFFDDLAKEVLAKVEAATAAAKALKSQSTSTG